ncbi:shikimate kinase [Salinimicrobium oceani]|uniref:Shikimate kinase n=1 Tax=Salinimicrobium oceani TaxID=2722702 RepID=A0ABX1D4R3_9FLAO|nr:shikimate kinase [Salinimicrobium oceani]NJW53986.1 shikimate kinase [Salinimicrobium oceani]
MKIILIGYMGSGKSVVGKALAVQKQLPFLDLDEEISRREKKSIPEIFSDAGEIYFRRKEAEVLKELLEQEANFVLSLGGGTPCYGKNLELIKNAAHTHTVFLKTGLEELTARLIKERENRPLIQEFDTPALLNDFIRKHLFERNYYYNQSDLSLVTDDKSVPQLVTEIENYLN